MVLPPAAALLWTLGGALFFQFHDPPSQSFVAARCRCCRSPGVPGRAPPRGSRLIALTPSQASAPQGVPPA